MKNMRLYILLIAITVCAVPAFGQYQQLREISADDGSTGGGWTDSGTYATGSYLDNPCTSWYDQVWVNYNVYLDQEGKNVDNGERVIFNENTTMGGAAYAASGKSTTDVTYKQQAYTIRKYYKVNTGDMFHVVTVIDFDPGSNTSYVSLETACGNGLPDSPE